MILNIGLEIHLFKLFLVIYFLSILKLNTINHSNNNSLIINKIPKYNQNVFVFLRFQIAKVFYKLLKLLSHINHLLYKLG